MNGSEHYCFVTLVPADAARLADARRHQRHLEKFPTWAQPSDADFLQQMGENLFHLAFPTREGRCQLNAKSYPM
jgi:hypothetical protein